jgi:hypothetical protein
LTSALYLILSQVFVFSRTNQLPKRNAHYFDDDNCLHGLPSDKHCSDDDESPSSTPPLDPLRRRVGDEVRAEALPVAEVAVPPLIAHMFVLVAQDDSGSDGEGSDDLGSNDSEVSGRMMAKTKPCASLSG